MAGKGNTVELKDQSHLALLLLQQFLNRALADHKPSRVWWEAMRRIRQKQAQEEFEAMELAHGKVRESGQIKDSEIPF
jgi:hypothetical protein